MSLHRVPRAGLALLFVSSLVACSSSSSKHASSTTGKTAIITIPTTTTTTLPSAVLKAALATFFAHDGAKLLAFERATEPLGNGRVPSKAACSDYINKKLPPIGGPNLLVSITERIPDPALQQAWKADVAGKHLFLAACDTNTKIPVQAAVTIRDNQNKLRGVAAKHGIML